MFLVSGIFGTATDVNDVNIIIYRNLFEAAEKEFKAAEKKLESEISDKDLRLLIIDNIDNIENNVDIKNLIEEYLKAEDLKNLLPSIRINLPLKKEKIIDFIFNKATEYRGINSILESLSKKINIKFAEIVNVNTNNNLKDHITDRHSAPFYGSHTMKKDICKYVIDYFKAKKNFDNNKRKLNSLRALSKGHSISLN